MARVVAILAVAGLLALVSLVLPSRWIVGGLLAWTAVFWLFWLRLVTAPWVLLAWRQQPLARQLDSSRKGIEHVEAACLLQLVLTGDGWWVVGMLAMVVAHEAVFRLDRVTSEVSHGQVDG